MITCIQIRERDLISIMRAYFNSLAPSDIKIERIKIKNKKVFLRANNGYTLLGTSFDNVPDVEFDCNVVRMLQAVKANAEKYKGKHIQFVIEATATPKTFLDMYINKDADDTYQKLVPEARINGYKIIIQEAL